jgi:hypothetical protein
LESILNTEDKEAKRLIKYAIKTYRYNSENYIHKKLERFDLMQIIETNPFKNISKIAKIVEKNLEVIEKQRKKLRR